VRDSDDLSVDIGAVLREAMIERLAERSSMTRP
jgi:hypothetical protein